VGRGRDGAVTAADPGRDLAGLLADRAGTVVLAQAAVLALAMDARGFAGAHRRTWAGATPWRLPDTLVLLGALLVLVTAAVARVLVT